MGVAMGSPLAPVLANFFMGHYEKLWLNNYTGPKVLYMYYRWYVDDIICCFKNSNDAHLFFEYLNSCHPNIKFTMETEEKGQLPFLDVLLSKQSASDHQGSFITFVYHKKMYTGLLTNYFSFTAFKYKLGLIKTLIPVDRAFKINNTTRGFHNDIKNLSEILKRNMFPKWLILTNQLKVILVRLQQQERTLLNVKHPTTTSTSYLISVTCVLFFLHWKKNFIHC